MITDWKEQNIQSYDASKAVADVPIFLVTKKIKTNKNKVKAWTGALFNITFLPASLLCRFINRRAFFLISRASTNLRENSMPCLMSAEQPPHFQPSSWL